MPAPANLLDSLRAKVTAEGGVPDDTRALTWLVQQQPWAAPVELASQAAVGLRFDTQRLRGLLLHRIERLPRVQAQVFVDQAVDHAPDGWDALAEDAATLRLLPVWLLAARAGIAAPHPDAAAWVALYRDLARAVSPMDAMLTTAADLPAPRGLHGLLVESRHCNRLPVDPCGRPAWLHALAFRAGTHDGTALLNQDNARFLHALKATDLANIREPDGRTPGDYLTGWWLDAVPADARYATARFMEPVSRSSSHSGWLARTLLAEGVNPALATGFLQFTHRPPWVRELPPAKTWKMTAAEAASLAALIEAEGAASVFSQRLAQSFAQELVSVLAAPSDGSRIDQVTLQDCLPWDILAPALLAASTAAAARLGQRNDTQGQRACETAMGWLAPRLPSTPALTSASLSIIERALATARLERTASRRAARLLQAATATRLASIEASPSPRRRA